MSDIVVISEANVDVNNDNKIKECEKKFADYKIVHFGASPFFTKYFFIFPLFITL